MNKKTKIALWVTIPLVLVGLGAFAYRKIKGSNVSTPPSPLGSSMLAMTTDGASLMSNSSDSSAFIDYIDKDEQVVIIDSKYSEGSWWYKLSDVITSSDPSQGRTGWVKANYLTT